MKIISCLLINILLLFFILTEIKPQEEVRITLSKSIFIKTYKDKRIYVEERKIQKGESIWKIYKKYYKFSGRQIPSFIKILQEMNPKLKDINLIHPDQKIAVPFKILEIPASQEVSILKPPSLFSSYEERIKAKENLVSRLKELIYGLDKTFINTGDYNLLPLTTNSLTLDTSQTPIIEVNENDRIIINIDNSLPDEKRRLIASIFSNIIHYEIIDLNSDKKLEECIDKILHSLKFYAVERNPNPLLIFGEREEKIEGDWFVFKDSSLKEIYVIKLLREEQEIKQPTLSHPMGYDIKYIYLKRD